MVLNNNGDGPIRVEMIAFSEKGEMCAMPSVSISEMTPWRVSLKDFLAGAGCHFRSGNIQISYQGVSMQVTGQITVRLDGERLALESRMAMPGTGSHSRLFGLAYLPSRKAETFIVLTNIGSDPIDVGLRTSTQEDHLMLKARESRTVALNGVSPVADDLGRTFLIEVTHTGRVDDLALFGGVLNRQSGYAANLSFVDPSTAKSATLVGNHF